ncbi:hypothetical protein [Streptomyces sp. NPDC001494]
MAAADLIAFGATEYGELCLHRHDGTVRIRSRLTRHTDEVMVPLAPGLDVFTRALEAVDRYRNACWHPYPVEGGQTRSGSLLARRTDVDDRLYARGCGPGDRLGALAEEAA